MRPARTILLALAVLVAAALAAVPAPAAAAPPLAVFGDSYSLTVRDAVDDWPALLHEQGLVGRIANFAHSGATALTRRGPDFAEQLARWRRAGRPLGDTVVYLGCNDIGGDLARSRAGYQAGIEELVAAGATWGGNRLFLVQPHDVGSMPLFNHTAERSFLRGQTKDWDRFVAYTAHHVGATVVDVFAAIDRVLQDPRRYGFTNVTTVDRPGSATTALYREPFHVGQHGQAIIAQAIAQRLRRGTAALAAPDGGAALMAWTVEPWPAAAPPLFAAAFGSEDEPTDVGRNGLAWPH
jgi:phospholipase/lecithinase/hemolysin